MFRTTAAAAFGVGLSLSGAALGDAALPRQKDAWLEVRTPNFTLYSNAGESKSKAIGLDLERFRSVLLMLKESFTANTPVPTFVYVFKNEESLEPYLPVVAGRPVRAAGYFQATTDGNYIALNAASTSEPRSIVYHEYLHFFMHANFPPQPLWYSEGLAEYFSTFRANEKSAEIGRPVEGHVQFLRATGLTPLEKLFAVNPDSSDFNEESKQGVFYAQSWALVHYLMRGKPERTPQLGRFLVELQQGRPRDEAFREAFGTDPAGLLRELSAYIRRSAFVFTRLFFQERRVPSEAAVRRMSYEEVLFRLGDLAAHAFDERGEEAEAHFQAALAREPSFPEALSGLGWLRLRNERYEEAGELFRRAVAGGAADYRAYFYYGELLMRSLSSQPVFVGSLDAKQHRFLEEARAAFRRSIALNPEFAEARAALGRTYLPEDNAHLEEGIEALEAAVERLPSRKDVALDLASLYERRGERGKREALLKKALGPDAAAYLAKQPAAAGFQDSIAERVNQLLAERKDEEALQLFEQELAGAPEDVRAAYQEQLEFLKRGAARNRAARQYNEASEKLSRRDYQGALEGFERVAATAPDPELAKSAREEADRLRRLLARKPTKPRAPK